MNEDCFVCRIIEGRPRVANPRIVYDDEKVIAFLNQFPTQEGYTLVCPKRHVERYETELSADEWLYLLAVTQKISKSIADCTGAMRMYLLSLGSPQGNPHLHLHVCPCPPGTPYEQQQGEAIRMKNGDYMHLSDERLDEIADLISNRALRLKPNARATEAIEVAREVFRERGV